MSNYSGLNECVATPATISFAEKFMRSTQFQAVFHEGMALVEEASEYLDSVGRIEAKKLDSDLSFAYATESMRLTTRLMQVASWLLIKRAVNEGEMSLEQAETEEGKLNFYHGRAVKKVDSFKLLPDALQDLVNKSFSFHKRMQRIDEMMKNQQEGSDSLIAEGKSPVTVQMAELEQVFGQLKRQA